AWISGSLARRDGVQKVQVIDEAWALLANPASVRHLQASWKLCRDYGVANIAIAHRIADLRAQADDGTALAKIAAGLLGDTETRSWAGSIRTISVGGSVMSRFVARYPMWANRLSSYSRSRPTQERCPPLSRPRYAHRQCLRALALGVALAACSGSGHSPSLDA